MSSDREVVDMEYEAFREHGRAVIDRIADYLAHPGAVDVLPDIRPGAIRSQLPEHPPEEPEPFDRILEDYDRLRPVITSSRMSRKFSATAATAGSTPTGRSSSLPKKPLICWRAIS